jgi:tRNA-dihydrouridine synthase A
MLEPALVADCVAAMVAAVRVPVTVKMRIGVVSAAKREVQSAVAGFGDDEFDQLRRFVASVCDAGSQAAIVHARKAVLGGLSPKDNREVPPLRYEVVRRLKLDFPSLPLVVNGGLREVAAVVEALEWCDGVMLGREAYHRPFLLAELQQLLYPGNLTMPSREALLERMEGYARRELAAGGRLSAITRHMLGLYNGQPGAREYRRTLSEGARAAGAGSELLRQSIPTPVPQRAAL